MITAIIFDCFGVLTKDIWKEFAGGLTEAQQSQVSDLNRAYNSGHLRRQEFIHEVSDVARCSPEDVEHSISLGSHEKNDRLFELLPELCKEYKLGLLSNIASDWITASFLSPSEQKWFTTIITSRETGMTKPDENIFRHTALEMGVASSECIMVDDSPGHCEGARQAGMQTILYENYGQFEGELQAMLAAS